MSLSAPVSRFGYSASVVVVIIIIINFYNAHDDVSSAAADAEYLKFGCRRRDGGMEVASFAILIAPLLPMAARR
jgi:hypothetical protein